MTQYFELDFSRPVQPQELRIQFQAGFAAESCTIQILENGQMSCVQNLDFQDVHSVQTALISPGETLTTSKIRFVFDEFTDFYGRVIVYRLEVWGYE